MRGDRFQRLLWLGLSLSVAMHAGVGVIVQTIPMHAAAASSRLPAGSLTGELLTLDTPEFPDPAAVPPDQPPPVPPEELAAAPEPKPLPPPTPPLLDQHEIPFKLGIADSDLNTENWLGVKNPTEHLAPLAAVNQPQLDPHAGAPGLPAPAAPPPAPFEFTPPTAGPPPAPPAAPQPATEPAMGPARPPTPPPQPESPPVKPRDGDPGASGEKLVQPKPPSPEAARRSDPNLPGPAPDPQHSNPQRPSKIEAHDPSPVKPAQSTPSTTPPSPNSPTPGRESSNTPPVPPAPRVPASESGSSGKPGEHSDKESDAFSTTPTVEIRPGQPGAAQGLEITTRRPIFTRLTRVTAFPANPLLKATFNNKGIVTKVTMLESSGVPDVDGPVINALYEWTAKGKAINELSPTDPTAGVTITLRILLR